MERRTFWSSAIAAVALAWSLPAASQSSEQAIAVSVDASAPGPVIDRNIFGQFAEHLGHGIYDGIWVGPGSPVPNVRGIRSDVVTALKALHVPNVRWPGGCYGDEYHWRDGVGPTRRARVNASWGMAIEPDSFGTHEFMDFASQIGADPYVSVNVGSGTVQEAADWLEYMTVAKPTALAQERAANGHPAPYKVGIIGLGNENWGCGGAMSPEHYVEEMKDYAHYVRDLNPAQEGPNAPKRIAVGWDGGSSDYTEAVMKAWKDKVWSWDIEGVSLHAYTIPNTWEHKGASVGFGEDDYAKTLAATLKMNDLLAHQSAIMDRYDPAKKLALFVDEWGVWADPNPGTNPGFLQQQNTLRDAIVAALNLNIFTRHADRVRGANIAQMINVLQAMILTDGPRMLLTPTYHVYRMYVPFQGATAVPVRFDAGSYQRAGVSVQRVDVMAARDPAGRLWLSMVNLDPTRPAHLEAALPGVAARTVSGEVLTGAAVDSHNSFEQPREVEPHTIAGRMAGGRVSVDLPPKSVAVLEVR